MRHRKGFTLTELLIVIGVMLLLSTLALMTFKSSNGDKMRSAARVAQSAFMGAKDRAMHAKQNRGLRLVFDENNPKIATGFIYLQPVQHDPYPVGSIQLERIDANNDGAADFPDVVIVRGVPSMVDWTNAAVVSHFSTPSLIRIPATTGQWYQYVNLGNGTLRLTTPFLGNSVNASPAVIASPSGGKSAQTSCDIQFSPEVLPFHQPIPLPSGTVIDLSRSSAAVQSILAITPTIDIMFSPRGNIAGATGGLGAIQFVLRSIEDAVQNLDPADPKCTGDCLIISVNPQTGLVQTYDADLTDANADGIADNLFSFAQAGKAAGR